MLLHKFSDEAWSRLESGGDQIPLGSGMFSMALSLRGKRRIGR